MPLGRKITLFILATSLLFGAQFKEYYRSGEPVTPQEISPPKAPQPTIRSAPANRPAQPIRSDAPTVRTRVVSQLPPFYFGWTGNFLIRGSVGAVRQDRAVKVKTNRGGEEVYYKPTNHYMGNANGSTLTHSDSELFFRPQIGFGYQLINEGNFWTLDYYSTSDVSELLFNYAFTFADRRIASAVPYIKLIAGAGDTDSKGLSPSTLSFGLGVGAYHYLDSRSKFRMEYGFDYTRREWLPINHSYGKEEWRDLEAHLYLGVAYKF